MLSAAPWLTLAVYEEALNNEFFLMGHITYGENKVIQIKREHCVLQFLMQFASVYKEDMKKCSAPWCKILYIPSENQESCHLASRQSWWLL